MSPLAITLGRGRVLGHHLVLERALGVGDVALGDVLGGQLLHSLVIVIHFALLVVLGGEGIFVVPMDVFSLNDLPNIEELDRVVDSILDLQIVLPDLLQVDLEHRDELLRNLQLVLNSRQNRILQDDVLNRVEVDRSLLAHLVLVQVGGKQLLVDEDRVESVAPGLDLDLPQAEDRGEIGEVPELGQARLLLLISYVLLQEQEQVPEELPAVERYLHIVLQSLRPLRLVLINVLRQHLRWLADFNSLVRRLGELLDDLRLRFLISKI